MSKKNKEEKFEKKPLLNSQIELMSIKIQAFSQVVNLMNQKKIEIENSMNQIASELGIPDEQLGEWALSQDRRTLLRVGKKKRSLLKTVKKKKKSINKKQKQEK